MLLQLAFAGLLCLAHAVPTSRVSEAFEKIEQIPKGWSTGRDARPDDIAKFSISLRQSNLPRLEQFVLDVSTPGHALYGQHLPKHELARLVEPPIASVDIVRDWLVASNVTSVYHDGHWVTFWTSVDKANALLDTTFSWYSNQERGEEKLRTTQYSLPRHVAQYVNFITPTVKFPGLKPMRSTIHSVQRVKDSTPMSNNTDASVKSAAVPATCDYEITPTCLLELYNIYYTADATNGNKVAFASFLKEYARKKDLKKFIKSDAKWAVGSTYSVIEFNGGGNSQTSKQDSTEANLDDQYVLSLTYPTPVTEFSTGGCGPLTADPNEPAGSCDNEPYLPFLNGVLALDDSELPQTISVSYGEDEQTWPYAEAVQVCNLFMQLGARGVSILFASGDYGPGDICENNSGGTVEYLPNFPASCPWVTTVGATQNVGPEEAADFSGGGFSNYFARPSWQNASVNTYLAAQNSKFAKYYNASGRGYPDVAAQGVSFDIYDSGYEQSVDGTSAATPTFAAVIALLNSALVSAGQAPLGFLNPFLYGTAAGAGALTDITQGSSSGCSGQINNAGWAATAGWDAATGLGTPDFGALLGLTVPQACNTKGVLGKNPSSTTCAGATATAKAK